MQGVEVGISQEADSDGLYILKVCSFGVLDIKWGPMPSMKSCSYQSSPSVYSVTMRQNLPRKGPRIVVDIEHVGTANQEKA